MVYSRYIWFERAVILFFATVACALLTMSVGIGMIHFWLPPTDGAYGKPWFSIEVMTVAGPLCTLCVVIAYPVMLWGLARTNLGKSLPVVFASPQVRWLLRHALVRSAPSSASCARPWPLLGADTGFAIPRHLTRHRN